MCKPTFDHPWSSPRGLKLGRDHGMVVSTLALCTPPPRMWVFWENPCYRDPGDSKCREVQLVCEPKFGLIEPTPESSDRDSTMAWWKVQLHCVLPGLWVFGGKPLLSKNGGLQVQGVPLVWEPKFGPH